MDDTTHKRVFFALWPDARLRSRISRSLPPEVSGRPVPQANYHLTLHFLGQVTSSMLECCQQAVHGIELGGFSLRFDSFGLFARAGVLWLGCSRPPPPLFELVDELGHRLVRCGYRAESRRFRPHLTLYRKVRSAALPAHRLAVPDPPIDWQVSDFSLLESVPDGTGVSYRPLNTWALGSGV